MTESNSFKPRKKDKFKEKNNNFKKGKSTQSKIDH